MNNFKKSLLAILIVLSFSVCSMAKNKQSNVTKYPAYKGLVMAGYQGWFRAPKDGGMYPDEKKVRIDIWPEVLSMKKPIQPD